MEVLPGNAPDNLGVLELVERSEANTGEPVEETLGDAAYGDGDTRQAFADAGRTLIARVQGRPNRSHFPKEDFLIDLEAVTCICPAGMVTRNVRPSGTRTDPTGRIHRLQGFRFDAAVCGVCPLRSQCVAGSSGLGRTVQLHPQENLLQRARALQQSEAFAGYRQWRVEVELRLARLVQLGIRQARYFGRAKTKFQLYLAATMANLTLVAGKAGSTGDIGGAAIGGQCRQPRPRHFCNQPWRDRVRPGLAAGIADDGFSAYNPRLNQGFSSAFLGCTTTNLPHVCDWKPDRIAPRSGNNSPAKTPGNCLNPA